MKDKAFKYRYELQQIGPGRIELFGRDTKLSDNQLEEMRRELNQNSAGRVYVVRLWLVNQKSGKVAARSSNHTLAAQPLFQVIA
jgi:hypothetical protein